MMKLSKFALLLLLITGCATGYKTLYEVRMMNGDTLYSKSKPSLNEDGYYRFKDVNNQTYILNKNLVLFIDKTEIKQ